MQNIPVKNPAERNRLLEAPKISYKDSLGIVDLSKWQAHRKQQECISKALAQPLPGPAKGAFLNRAIEVNGKQIQRITPYIWLILTALDSPLLKLLEAATNPSNAEKKELNSEWSSPQKWEACLVFSLSRR